jgi:hypothetical protein
MARTVLTIRLTYLEQARLPARGRDEPPPTLLRTPAALLRGARRLCRGITIPGRSRYSFVPRLVATRRATGSPPERRVQLGTAHDGGGASGVFLHCAGRGPAGVGRTTGMTSGSSPYSVRQLHADLVGGPRPTGGPRPGRSDQRGRQVGRGRRPLKASGCRGCGPGHTGADSWSIDIGMSSHRLAPQAPVRRRLAGRPVAQCLTNFWTSKTSLVCSM